MLDQDTASLRKARGAFFTPIPVARFLVNWAVRRPDDAVLEPSCGEAVFLHQLGQRATHTGRLVGVELHAASARKAEKSLRADGIAVRIHTGDFFLHSEFGEYDAVVGNPPFIRYQDFAGDARLRAREAALRAGVPLTNLASSWAAFTVHSALHLKAGGRLALVLPAELLTVNYASPVRQFLLEHFAEIRLVVFEQRIFPDVLEEVVLLLADDYRPKGDVGTDHMTLWPLRNAEGLVNLADWRRWTPPHKTAKWTAGLMSADGSSAYDSALRSDAFVTLESWGDTTLGMVTGDNRFFTLSPEKVLELGLAQTDVITVSPPGSRHLRRLTLTKRTLATLGNDGLATRLFRPSGEPSKAAWRYIKSGELLDVHRAYKCRVRNPWWRVPYLRPADLLLTYMNADTPRIASNGAQAHHLNSVHGIYLRDEYRAIGMELLPIASLNSVTLLGAETVGRAYGGGMLKVEPREADLLPMPSPEVVAQQADELRAAQPQVAKYLRAGRLLDAVAVIDDVLLVGAGARSRRNRARWSLTTDQLRYIRADHAALTARRTARGQAARHAE
ncbi:N-6 DNA methylase [Mycobacterium sp. AT1]|uniref:N-6 DNA methylase n=1 Tax=Mycobacterium sp. AT1 TaxID=1961706 RepID=UPI0009AD765A|nr:N-6 DNA methylase [Mycobacterium sp. AT1]OPX08374.1 SAM-dependent methyltransferase [Mycobacterium sp. AT1]